MAESGMDDGLLPTRTSHSPIHFALFSLLNFMSAGRDHRQFMENQCGTAACFGRSPHNNPETVMYHHQHARWKNC